MKTKIRKIFQKNLLNSVEIAYQEVYLVCLNVLKKKRLAKVIYFYIDKNFLCSYFVLCWPRFMLSFSIKCSQTFLSQKCRGIFQLWCCVKYWMFLNFLLKGLKCTVYKEKQFKITICLRNVSLCFILQNVIMFLILKN